MLLIYGATLRWVSSSLCMSYCWYESLTDNAYSTKSLTGDVYAFSLNYIELLLLRRMKPMVLHVLAFPQMVDI